MTESYQDLQPNQENQCNNVLPRRDAKENRGYVRQTSQAQSSARHFCEQLTDRLRNALQTRPAPRPVGGRQCPGQAWPPVGFRRRGQGFGGNREAEMGRQGRRESAASRSGGEGCPCSLRVRAFLYSDSSSRTVLIVIDIHHLNLINHHKLSKYFSKPCLLMFSPCLHGHALRR